jgi:hypothetical protein
VTAEKWVNFVETRAWVHFDACIWDQGAGRLRLTFSENSVPEGLTLMLPEHFGDSTLMELNVDDAAWSFTEREQNGEVYGCADLPGGCRNVVAVWS